MLFLRQAILMVSALMKLACIMEQRHQRWQEGIHPFHGRELVGNGGRASCVLEQKF